MRWIYFILMLLLLTPNHNTLQAASQPAVQEVRVMNPPVKPAVKKSKKLRKNKFRPQKASKQQSLLLLVIILWFAVIVGMTLAIIAFTTGIALFTIIALSIFGFFDLINLIVFMFTYPTISGGEVMANFVIAGFVITVLLVNLLAGISFLIWGLIVANLILWLTGIAALGIAAIFMLTIFFVNATNK